MSWLWFKMIGDEKKSRDAKRLIIVKTDDG